MNHMTFITISELTLYFIEYSKLVEIPCLQILQTESQNEETDNSYGEEDLLERKIQEFA